MRYVWLLAEQKYTFLPRWKQARGYITARMAFGWPMSLVSRIIIQSHGSTLCLIRLFDRSSAPNAIVQVAFAVYIADTFPTFSFLLYP